MTSTAMASGAVVSSAGAQVPYVRSFVQQSDGSAITTAYTLVGQILNNGQTNFVGYTEGSAQYVGTTSAADAQQTTLDDGMSYYVYASDAPAGYLVTSDGAGSGTSTGSGSSPNDEDSSTALSAPTSTSESSDSSESMSSSAAAETSADSAAGHLSAKGAVALGLGMLAVLALNSVA